MADQALSMLNVLSVLTALIVRCEALPLRPRHYQRRRQHRRPLCLGRPDLLHPLLRAVRTTPIGLVARPTMPIALLASR